jgi:hypothetical protein
MTKEIEKSNTTPTTDPQDPGFDLLLGYVATRDPTINEPLIYNGYPYLQQLWQTVESVDDFATFTTTGYWLSPDNTASALIWWKMVFDANILSVLSARGWKINTTRGYTDQSSLGFNAPRRPSLTNDTAINVSVLLDNTNPVNFQISPDGVTYETISTLAIQSNTCSESVILPAGYYYQLTVSGGATPTLVILKELSQ